MIAGVGTDVVKIERIRQTIERYGEAFLHHVFTPEELAEAARRRNPWPYYAGRWALKESLSKALGCGIGTHCGWQDIQTLNDANGRPLTAIGGAAAERAAELDIAHVHVSISHEEEYACATVILERR
ncbi:MAG: holo-ACP synthase [Victivallales bacterium]|nr:holo-ACP synthase [Victivallales bacterium]